ncbi:16S rRNA (cytosine(967)-C(5))-methyltransferase RsmB [Vaginisenegalia massiliensis]|uniref:16S rRNA (cytosine(967)-C(5))-methyltransferase RsmB n=1 Tax=Vaginisenegalia massiliensis TaxID=2058294 RepID=UPI000F545ED3|nr:16S rRNA (cytosine(967)-C(5))-methyltransferase RsmB [Vaginisenegalia massiliensis]
MKIKNIAAKKLASNVRWQALKIINQVEYQAEYSNVLIDRFMNQSELNEQDNRLLVQLVYGTIQYRKQLDYHLADLIRGKKLEDWVASLLRLSAYQMFYLDRIPEHAIINEAVSIAKWNGHDKLGGFVNAVLRSLQRQGQRNILAIDDPIKRYAILYSLQEWIVETIFTACHQSHEKTKAVLESLLWNPIVSARLNTGHTTKEAILRSLELEGFVVEEGAISPSAIRCVNQNVVNSHAFEAGWLTIQDESSMLVAPLGKIQGDEQILDACSAPGGKATHIASLLNSQGYVTALDLSAAKLQKVKEHAERLSLADKFSFQAIDARKFMPQPGVFYDIIYIDAPCSGLGLMRRKPEIKYQKSYEDVLALVAIQKDLLRHLAQFVKPGGRIIYSTCTLTREENEELIANFVKEEPEFNIEPITQEEILPKGCLNEEGQIRMWPHQYHTDGFFICRLIKEK